MAEDNKLFGFLFKQKKSEEKKKAKSFAGTNINIEYTTFRCSTYSVDYH